MTEYSLEDIVGVQLGSSLWWPAQILEIHSSSEFVVVNCIGFKGRYKMPKAKVLPFEAAQQKFNEYGSSSLQTAVRTANRMRVRQILSKGLLFELAGRGKQAGEQLGVD
eukprot:TRINITY_DN17976_c0_g1_i1.p2 TRINITY_DN17976_c0_g1~~TRINITY_DN17976_c0_g1_i1.p2  ORF type:complete len:118 (+),score=17.14 TRINITY_DN17976_c0_g1_i1:29-355(+)